MVKHVVRVDVAGRDLDVQVSVGVKAIHDRDVFPVLGIDFPGHVFDLHFRLPVGGDLQFSRLAADHLSKSREKFGIATEKRRKKIVMSHRWDILHYTGMKKHGRPEKNDMLT